MFTSAFRTLLGPILLSILLTTHYAFTAPLCHYVFSVDLVPIENRTEYVGELSFLLKSNFNPQYRIPSILNDSQIPTNPYVIAKQSLIFVQRFSEKLTMAEKEIFADMIKKTEPHGWGSKEVKFLLLLSLHDREAWLKIGEKSFLEDNNSAALKDFIGQQAPRLSLDIRHQILKKLGPNYLGLVKVGMVLGPKRFADYLFKILLRGDSLIRSELSKGKSGLEAYRRYIDAVHGYMKNDSSLSFEHILAIINQIQKSLNKHYDRLTTNEPNVMLYMGGSVPNGRATARSDVDLLMNDKVKSVMEGIFSDEARHLIPEVSILRFGPEFWAELHPVAIQISREEVHLMIFSPNSITPELIPLNLN